MLPNPLPIALDWTAVGYTLGQLATAWIGLGTLRQRSQIHLFAPIGNLEQLVTSTLVAQDFSLTDFFAQLMLDRCIGLDRFCLFLVVFGRFINHRLVDEVHHMLALLLAILKLLTAHVLGVTFRIFFKSLGIALAGHRHAIVQGSTLKNYRLH